MRFLIIFSLYTFLSSSLFAENQDVLTSFLKMVQSRSLSLKINREQLSSQIAGNEAILAPFDWQTNLGITGRQERNLPSITTKIDSTQTILAQTQVSKLWEEGWQTDINYSIGRTQLKGNFGEYASSIPPSFVPNFSVSASTNLLKDLMADRLSYTRVILEQTQKSLTSQSKLERKQHLVSSLLDLANILQINETMELQRQLCSRVAKQTRKLAEKNRRGIVNKKDYLLSRKEYNSCQSTIKTLNKQTISLKESLLSTYGVKFEEIPKIDIDAFYLQIKQLYTRFANHKKKLTFDDQEDMQALKDQKSLLEARSSELKANARDDITLSMTAGIQGTGDSFADGHESLIEGQYPYVQAAVSYALPAPKRDVKAQIISNQFQQKALDYSISQLRSSKQSRFAVLSQTLERDFSIYQDLETNVELSQEILTTAEKEFNNGRLDFITLTDFQKGVIQSQSQLSAIRADIIISTIEFSDFFDFFDNFYN